MHLGKKKGESLENVLRGYPLLGYSLAIDHGEVFAAALAEVAVVVAGRTVAATLSVVLQYLLKVLWAIAVEDGCLAHSKVAVDALRAEGVALDAMTFSVIDEGQQLSDGVMVPWALDLQGSRRIELRSCLFWQCN